MNGKVFFSVSEKDNKNSIQMYYIENAWYKMENKNIKPK